MNEAALRGLRVAVVVMGVLIVLGIMGLVGALAYRAAGRNATIAPVAPGVVLPELMLPAGVLPELVLDEPPGTRLGVVSQTPDRILLLLQGGGPDRVLVVNARTNQVLQRIRLAR